MPRTARIAPGGIVYHVLNRANARLQIFDDEGDYAAFEKIMAETQDRTPMRILAYCVMPNHWHLVLWPTEDDELRTFMMRLTGTHVRRWHAHRHSLGNGHLYQGRYKSFPTSGDDHLLTVLRYVERNPLRAGLVNRAEEWRWSSLWLRRRPRLKEKPRLSDWPVRRPRTWTRLVNEPLTQIELDALRVCNRRGRPFGDESWVEAIVKKLRLESTIRPRGRPRKGSMGG